MQYKQKVIITDEKYNGFTGIIILVSHPKQYRIQLSCGARIWVDKTKVSPI